MKKIICTLLCLFVVGCFSDTTDLKSHIEQVKANTTSTIEPMPTIPEFNHFDYSAYNLRSPFDAPTPEEITKIIQQTSDCLSPDPNRRKQPLEKYALESLSMRGTLAERGIMWALLEAGDASVHRVSVGSYLGLFHGRITTVTPEQVRIVELVPDGSGCWVERETDIGMSEFGSEGQGK